LFRRQRAVTREGSRRARRESPWREEHGRCSAASPGDRPLLR
jgi:hypothetical protein